MADTVLHGDARDERSLSDGCEVRGDRSVRPLANYEQRLVLVDGEEWPLSCGRLMLERDHSPNVCELTTKLRIEVEPHGVDPAVLDETTQYHRNRALEDRWWTWTIW